MYLDISGAKNLKELDELESQISMRRAQWKERAPKSILMGIVVVLIGATAVHFTSSDGFAGLAAWLIVLLLGLTTLPVAFFLIPTSEYAEIRKLETQLLKRRIYLLEKRVESLSKRVRKNTHESNTELE